MERYDVIVVGAGLAGLVAATEAAERGFSVCIVDQEGEQNLGGQAFWSLGGLFFVDSPEQRRMRVRDSLDLARQDWFGSAGFDRPEDYWPRRWAEAYLDFAAGENANGCTVWACAGFPWSAGPSAAAASLMVMAIPFRVSMSRGARVRAYSHPSLKRRRPWRQPAG